MKKRTTVRCAAANDDDFETPEPQKQTGPTAQDRSDGNVATADGQAPPKRRKKEFAWMDSDDEDDEDDEAKSGDGKSAEEEGEDTVKVDAAALDAATSFGAMVRLAEGLQKRLKAGAMEGADIAAAYRAINRAKFFDGELLESLNGELCKLLAESKATDQIAGDAIECLSVMNAYDKHVFSSIAQFFGPRITTLDPAMAKKWLQSFRRFEHTAEKDFLQMLEATPMAPTHPGYKTIRCRHDSEGTCALGVALCTFSHDPRALPSLEVADAALQRPASIMLTHGQLHQGRGAYTNTPSYKT